MLLSKERFVIQEQILHLEVLAIAEAGQHLACKKVMGRQLGHTYQHYGEYDSLIHHMRVIFQI